MMGPGRLREPGYGALCLVAYLAAAWWALQISLDGPVLIWFPPAAVAIAFLYARPRLVVVVAVAEVVSTSWIMGLGDEFGVLGLAVNSVGLAAAYATGALVLRRLGLGPGLRTVDDLLVLAVGIGVASTLAAAIGIGVQVWVDLVPSDDLARSFALFWIGDVVGAVCLLPALLLVITRHLAGEPQTLADDEASVPRALLVGELLLPALAALGLIVFGDSSLRFTYLAFVPMVIVAVRHGVAAAALAAAGLGAVMTAGAHAELASALDRSDFQLLMLVLTLSGVVTGALVSARRDVFEVKERVSEIVEASPDLVATVARDGSIRYLNPVGRRLMGLDPEALLAQPAFDFLPDDLARDLMREGMRAAERSGSWTGENRLRRADGQVVPVSQVLISHRHPGDPQPQFSTVCRDMTDQRRLEDQLRRAALYDEATGLPNRALLMDQLSRTTGVDRERGTAVLFADLDHLDRVNQTFGFVAGDQVVTTIAERVLEAVRGQDLVARYGGAQFVVVLHEVPDEFEAIVLADRLLACFAAPVPVDGHELEVSGSVGIAIAGAGQPPVEALRAAEIALHRAKEAGGGRFALFDRDLEARSQHRQEIEADLREALATGTWTLAYQPIIEAESRRVVSVEALLRFTHPTRGPVAPFELIRLAETSGAIVRLGREIFRRACAETLQWHRLGFDLSVAINVSARQLREPALLDDVRSVIAETGIPADRVVVELTETVLATDEHGEIATLRSLRDLGCRIALDDFGTGYSSLSELRHLPIDIVKLDQSFITDLTSSPRSAALVAAVVQLADALGLVVVAEGVEQEDQLEALAALGCHRIQGYAFSRPLPPDAITGLLQDARPPIT